MDLPISDWKAINNALRRLYEELDSEKHSRMMLQTINDLVPGDSVALNIVRQVSPYQMDAVTFPEDHTAPEQLALIEKYSFQSPFLSYYASAVDASWKTITDFIPEEEFHKTELYRLGLGPVGARYQIFGALGYVDGVGYGVVINRAQRGFTEREREILNTIQPHLVTSFINAAVHSRTQNSVAQITAAMESVPGAFGFLTRMANRLGYKNGPRRGSGNFLPTKSSLARAFHKPSSTW